MKTALLVYLILNGICFMAGFMWTMLDGKLSSHRALGPMVVINLDKPGPYLLFGYTAGHFTARGLQELF